MRKLDISFSLEWCFLYGVILLSVVVVMIAVMTK